MIRLLIADDHPLVRDALANLLAGAGDIDVVGVTADGREAVSVALETHPDVVLMDLEMPELNGMDATRALQEAGSAARVVVLTTFSDRDRIVGALDAGALGYLLKDADPEEVATAIRAAAAGEVHLDAAVARQLTRRMAAPQAGLSSLTAREREILTLVAQGHSNREIAERLVISERTARTHVSNVLTKLQLASRTQAALLAIREGLIAPPS